jgi:DNA mismatch endonuclease (patch repair protein)
VGAHDESDPPVAEVDSVRMSRVRGSNTQPELRLRRALHRRGLRYRVGVRPLVGLRRTADLVFRSAKVAVMIDGCFWHRCPDHYRPSTKRAAFWEAKIQANVARDADTDRLLSGAGWHVERVWEHEDVEQAADRIVELIRRRQKLGR